MFALKIYTRRIHNFSTLTSYLQLFRLVCYLSYHFSFQRCEIQTPILPVIKICFELSFSSMNLAMVHIHYLFPRLLLPHSILWSLMNSFTILFQSENLNFLIQNYPFNYKTI